MSREKTRFPVAAPLCGVLPRKFRTGHRPVATTAEIRGNLRNLRIDSIMAEHTGFQKLVAEAKNHMTEISPQAAAAKLKSGDAVVIDVRDKDEWDEGHIPDATHISRGTIEL